MNDRNVNFIKENQIDSFLKLNFLLFLQRQPDLDATIQELAERSYLGYTALLEKIIADLQSVGLIDQTGNGYKLHCEPGVSASLKHLATTFANPVTRQKLLAQVCSAYSDAETRALCQQIGVDRFMSKPIDVEKVDAAIKETLNRQTQVKEISNLHTSFQGGT